MATQHTYRDVTYVSLNPATADAARECSVITVDTFRAVEDPDFLHRAMTMAHALPGSIRRTLIDLKFRRLNVGGVVISGFPIDERTVGPTPSHWSDIERLRASIVEDAFLILAACTLGVPLAFVTQQDGTIVHEVFPIKAHEHDQLGCGSKDPLEWHTEDAFHPMKGTFLLLLCIRNPDRIPTAFACVDTGRLSRRTFDALFEEWYLVRPDHSHLAHNNSRTYSTTGRLTSFDYIQGLSDKPRRIAVLSGDRESPTVTIDPFFMEPEPGNIDASEALNEIYACINDQLQHVVLSTGDLLVIDNLRCVHGRPAFTARHDGTDRWLKRVNVY